MPGGSFDIKIGADYACFSRPEFKVERVTYPIITPSAARGVLEAIFWKPEFRWEVREIWLLNPIRQTALLRNELANRQGQRPLLVEHQRQQRASLILKDVAYLLRAEMVLQRHADAPMSKYTEQFARRLALGQFHHAPYLGTREFSAWFEPATGAESAIPLDLDFGTMLFDIAFREDAQRRELEFYRHAPTGRRLVWGYAEALFFNAALKAGVLEVPRELYTELYRLVGEHA